MNIEGSLSKLLNPVEKYGELIGAGLSVATAGQIEEWEGDLSNLLSGQIHAPNLQNMINDIKNTSQFKLAAIAAIAGYFGKDATNNSTIKKIAEIAQKVGTGYLVTGIAQELFYFSTHSSEGCDKAGYVKPNIQTSSVSSGLDFVRSS